MKTEDLEIMFFKVNNLPINYGYRLTNLDYINLAAIALEYKNAKEFRQDILRKLIEYPNDAVRKTLKIKG